MFPSRLPRLRGFRLALGASCALALSAIGGCIDLGSVDVEHTYPKPTGDKTYDPRPTPEEEKPGLFGPRGLVLYDSRGSAADDGSEGGGSNLGVNAFLWRASLEVLADMPIIDADSQGGVILTDWRQFPGAENERFKVQIYIFGKALSSEAIQATVLKQTLIRGAWRDAESDAKTAGRIEDRILQRARDMRVTAIGR